MLSAALLIFTACTIAYMTYCAHNMSIMKSILIVLH